MALDEYTHFGMRLSRWFWERGGPMGNFMSGLIFVVALLLKLAFYLAVIYIALHFAFGC
jgi:hypothetical protein